MKVKELIEILESLDPEREVIMQKDGEGNGHSPLYNVWVGKYKAETTWDGNVGMEKLTQGDIDAGYTEEDIMVDGVPAIILVPVN